MLSSGHIPKKYDILQNPIVTKFCRDARLRISRRRQVWKILSDDIKKLCLSAGIPEKSIRISRDGTNCSIMVEANK